PELPLRAVGLAVAVEDAAPVSPLLLAEPWVRTVPEAPDVAVGEPVTVALPPAAPLAWAVVTLEPPAAVGALLEVVATMVLTAAPPSAPPGVEPPPAPPVPPTATSSTRLSAAPVLPESPVTSAPAPLFERAVAVPATAADPVSPESPVTPLVAVPPV